MTVYKTGINLRTEIDILLNINETVSDSTGFRQHNYGRYVRN